MLVMLIMATDERNFRSAYYEKVGFRSVEEKKSLEILLKDKPLDKSKLRQFCLRFSVPATYRNLLWKLLLGVVPVYVDSHKFIIDQRQQEYCMLLRALQTMRAVDFHTPKPQVFYAAWIMQTNKWNFNVNLQVENGFTLIAQALMNFFEDDADIFWITRNFYQNLNKIEGDFPKLIEMSYNLLEKEDPGLYRHLRKIGVLEHLPLKKWFDCCFAGILNEMALGKIWDKICGGSYKILIFVVAVLLNNQRHKLLKCNNLASVVQIIKNIPEDSAEVIANKSIEMWQQHGSPLTVHDKPKP